MAVPFLNVRTEFASALNQVCAERGITPESVLESIKSAVLAAYRKDYGFEGDYQYQIDIDPESGAAKIFQYEEGKKKDKKDVTPPGFGRIAAQTAKQVILQKVREAEKAAIIDEYRDKVNKIVNGRVLRFDGRDIICDIGRGQGRMPLSEQVPSADYSLNKRLTFYIREIVQTKRGEEIIVSRSAPELVSQLFAREVPEVSSGAVEIKAIAREPGGRSKVAVVSTQPGVDPVGSCVGQKGVRVQAVINELNGEKIDIIAFAEDPVDFITVALSPAEDLKVKVDEKEKKAEVVVPEDQLSLAIGKNGQNVRLAAKLTGYKIDIQGAEEEKEKKAGKTKKTKKTKKKSVKKTKKTKKTTKKAKTKKKKAKAKTKSKKKKND